MNIFFPTKREMPAFTPEETMDFINQFKILGGFQGRCYLSFTKIAGGKNCYYFTTKSAANLRTHEICSIAKKIIDLSTENLDKMSLLNLDKKIHILTSLQTGLDRYEERVMNSIHKRVWIKFLQLFGYQPKSPDQLTQVKTLCAEELRKLTSDREAIVKNVAGAIVKLQARFRGNSVRQWMKNALPAKLLASANDKIVQKKVTEYPRARSGRSTVYLAKDIGVVFKICPKTNERIINANQLRRTCNYRGYTSLTVPRAEVFSNCLLIEEMIPANDTSTLGQVALYMENVEAFNEAAKQFTLLLCQMPIPDLLAGGIYTPNFGNAMLFLEYNAESNVGKIGFVDLADKRLQYEKATVKNVLLACKTALTFFPLHSGIILKATDVFLAKHKLLLTQEEREGLVDIRKCAIEYYERVYGTHSIFLKTHDMQEKDPCAISEPTEKQKQVIYDAMGKRLMNIHETDKDFFIFGAKKVLGENAEETLKQLTTTAFPELFNLCLDFLQQKLKKKLKNPFAPLSLMELSSHRTILFKTNEDMDFQELYINGAKKLTHLVMNPDDNLTKQKWIYEKEDITQCLLDTIFDGLKDEGVIATYELIDNIIGIQC